MTLQKTTNERLSTSTPLEFIEGKSPSEIADKLGIFLSTFELYFGKENSKFGPVRSGDTFGIIKNLDNLGTTTLIRERGKKREEVILESTDIFSEIYKPSKLLPSLEIKRQENGRYQVGSYEVTTTNMDTLRNEMQRIVIILTQTCMTRGELKQLSDLCKIETTGEKGKKGAPVYELKQNPAADAWYGNLLPERFWKSKQLHFDRILSILRNPEGGKVDQEEAAKQLERLFEEALEKEVMKK